MFYSYLFIFIGLLDVIQKKKKKTTNLLILTKTPYLKFILSYLRKIMS